MKTAGRQRRQEFPVMNIKGAETGDSLSLSKSNIIDITRIRKRKRIRADRISSFMLIIIMKVKELRSLLQKDIRENL